MKCRRGSNTLTGITQKKEEVKIAYGEEKERAMPCKYTGAGAWLMSHKASGFPLVSPQKENEKGRKEKSGKYMGK